MEIGFKATALLGEVSRGKSQAKLHRGDRKKPAFFVADRCKIHHGDRTVKIHRYLESSEHQEHFFSIMLVRLMRPAEVRWRDKISSTLFGSFSQ